MVKSNIKSIHSSHISRKSRKNLAKNKNKMNKPKKLFKRKIFLNAQKETQEKENQSTIIEEVKNKESSEFDQNYENFKNYYLKERIMILENDCKESINELHYKELELFKDTTSENMSQYFNENDRMSSLLSIYQMINEIIHSSKNIKDAYYQIPKSLLLDSITLFDYSLSKNNKILNQKDIVTLMFSSLYIISKYKNVPIFNSENLYLNFIDENDLINSQATILEDSRGEILPIKHLDFFQRVLFFFKRLKQNDINFLNYLAIFEKQYYDLSFMITFEYDINFKFPSVVFIIVMYAVNVNMENILKDQGMDFCGEIEHFLKFFKSGLEYSDDEYNETEIVIKKAFNKYKSIINKQSV